MFLELLAWQLLKLNVAQIMVIKLVYNLAAASPDYRSRVSVVTIGAVSAVSGVVAVVVRATLESVQQRSEQITWIMH